jgi:hypothetical protein
LVSTPLRLRLPADDGSFTPWLPRQDSKPDSACLKVVMAFARRLELTLGLEPVAELAPPAPAVPAPVPARDPEELAPVVEAWLARAPSKLAEAYVEEHPAG